MQGVFGSLPGKAVLRMAAKNGSVPVKLLEESYKEIAALSMEIFKLPFDFISPEEEIIDNYKTALLLDATDRYFYFLQN